MRPVIDFFIVGYYVFQAYILTMMSIALAGGVWVIEGISFDWHRFKRGCCAHEPKSLCWYWPVIIKVIACHKTYPQVRPQWNIWIYTLWGAWGHNFCPTNKERSW